MPTENRTILYYPTIDVPSNSWLRHALLYWDQVSSIVPRNIDNEVELSPDLHYLIDEGEFRPISPEELIKTPRNFQALQEFQDEFIEVVKSEQFQQFLKAQPFSVSRIRDAKVSKLQVHRIHSNKTSHTITDFLRDRGLALKREIDCWYFFERHTALLYMSLLAKYLADISRDQTTIGTDHGIYEKFNFGRITGDETYPVISLNLSRVLPTPRANIPLERLIDFKRRRMDNLIHFRKILMDFESKISKAKSNEEWKELTISFKENIQSGVKDLSKAMKDIRIEAFFKSLKSLFNFKTFAKSVAIAADQKYQLTEIPLKYKIVAAGIAGAIEISTQYVEVRNKLMSKHRESPFAYLYQAQRGRIMSKR